MTIRASTNSNFDRVLAGLRYNLSRLVLSQEQVATGRRILRPSDDPSGTARVLGFNRQIAGTERFVNAINIGRSVVDTGAVALENGSSTLAEVRENLIQGMNGTLSPNDREAIANEVELLRLGLLEIANTRSGDRTLFGGTTAGKTAFTSQLVGGRQRVSYLGNDEEQRIRIGSGVDIAITTPGSTIFASDQAGGTTYAGLTGAARGLTADEGSGYEYLTVRHDTTLPGTIGTVGLALANLGADDTFIGSETLVIDPVAGTVRLGSGPVRTIPAAGDPGFADFAVENAAGGELHLDFSGYTGAAYTGTLTATGSISIDDTTFTGLNLAANDLELTHPDSGNVIHVDATGITRAGRELVTFSGRVNAFDTLQGIADDLRNMDGLDQTELVARLDMWIGELDRNHENLLVGLGGLGSRSERLTNTEERLQGVQSQLEGLRSQEVDADLSEAAIEMARSQQQLELAQASGVRLLQTNLLNFLR